MCPPGAAATAAAFPKVAGLRGAKTGAIGGVGSSTLALIVSFNSGSEVPKPLGEPWIVWVALIGSAHRTALVQSTINRRRKVANQAVQLLCSHGGRNVEVGVGKQTRERGPVSLMPGATGGDKLKAQSHLEKDGIVVGTIVGSVHPPAGDSHRE